MNRASRSLPKNQGHPMGRGTKQDPVGFDLSVGAHDLHGDGSRQLVFPQDRRGPWNGREAAVTWGCRGHRIDMRPGWLARWQFPVDMDSEDGMDAPLEDILPVAIEMQGVDPGPPCIEGGQDLFHAVPPQGDTG